MGFVIKESIKSTVLGLIGAVLGAIGIVLAMKTFTKPELGLQQSLSRNSTLIVYLVAMGFDYTLMVMGQRFGVGNPKRGAFLRYSLIIPLVCFVVVLFPFLFLKDWVLDFLKPEDQVLMGQYYFYYPLITFFYLALFWISGYLRSIERTTFTILINEVLLRGIVLVLLLLFLMDWISFTQYVMLFAFSFLLPITMSVYHARKNRGFSFKVQETLTKAEKTKIFDFAFFHMMIIFSSVLAFQIDGFVFMIFPDIGLSNIGIYSICIYMVSILRMPLRMVGQNAIPSFTNYYDEGNMLKLRELYGRSALSTLTLNCLLTVLILVNLSEIQAIVDMWKPGFELISVLVPILLLGVFVELSVGLNFEILGVSKFYRLSFWIALGYLIAIVFLFYFGVKGWGLIGGAWAFSISMILFSLAKMSAVLIKFKMKPFSIDTLKVLAIAVLSLLVYFLPQLDHAFLSIMYKTVIVVLMYVGLIYGYKVGEDAPRIIGMVLERIRLKKNK